MDQLTSGIPVDYAEFEGQYARAIREVLNEEFAGEFRHLGIVYGIERSPGFSADSCVKDLHVHFYRRDREGETKTLDDCPLVILIDNQISDRLEDVREILLSTVNEVIEQVRREDESLSPEENCSEGAEIALEPLDGWVVCPECGAAWEVETGGEVTICLECRIRYRLVEKRRT